MRFFGGWLRVSVRYSARGWRNGQGQRQSPHRRGVFCPLAEHLTVKSRTSKGLENNSLLYPMAVNNLVAAAMNQAAELGFEMVDGDVVRGCEMKRNEIAPAAIIVLLSIVIMVQVVMAEPCRQHLPVQIWQYDLERNLYVFINRRKTTVCCFYP